MKVSMKPECVSPNLLSLNTWLTHQYMMGECLTPNSAGMNSQLKKDSHVLSLHLFQDFCNKAPPPNGSSYPSKCHISYVSLMSLGVCFAVSAIAWQGITWTSLYFTITFSAVTTELATFLLPVLSTSTMLGFAIALYS